MVFWVVTHVNVVDKSISKERANSFYRIRVKRKDVVRLYRHTTLNLLTEIHSRNQRTLAACFSETKTKIFSAIKNGVVYLVILPVTQTKVSSDWMIGNKCGLNYLGII